MGCTSSAPNMVNSSTSEKSIHSDEEISDVQSKDTEEIIYRAGDDVNEITLLPSRDILAENTNVVRNISTPSLKIEQENQDDKYIHEIINKIDSNVTQHEEDKTPRLEEVVEKVVEMHTSDNTNETQPISKTPEESQNVKENSNNNMKKSNSKESNEEHCELEHDKDELVKQSRVDDTQASPSKSESSRATRWEALADIAAELPPSLTVDPITGQIYALSK